MLDTFQRVYRGNGAPDGLHFDDVRRDPAPRISYETADGHRHFHLKDAVAYELRGDSLRIASPKTAIGFCLQDSWRYDEGAHPQPFYTDAETDDCGSGTPIAPEVKMGIQSGWQDFYPTFLPFQWVDVSEVSAGTYELIQLVDPTNVVAELSETNNVGAGVAVTIPGYRARHQTVLLRGARPVEIVLQAQLIPSELFGRPAVGPPEFRIVEPPKHGRLATSAEGWFLPTTVTYVPDSGRPRADEFTFHARDSNFPSFPRDPEVASVSIRPQAADSDKRGAIDLASQPRRLERE